VIDQPHRNILITLLAIEKTLNDNQIIFLTRNIQSILGLDSLHEIYSRFYRKITLSSLLIYVTFMLQHALKTRYHGIPFFMHSLKKYFFNN